MERRGGGKGKSGRSPRRCRQDLDHLSLSEFPTNVGALGQAANNQISSRHRGLPRITSENSMLKSLVALGRCRRQTIGLDGVICRSIIRDGE
jgi:hypothetical protein